jgi:SAM-dependent methyltransferase
MRIFAKLRRTEIPPEMPRVWNQTAFDAAFNGQVVGGTLNEEPAYYPRYKSRYADLLKRYAAMVPEPPQDVLDIGGGQFALLCKALWNDRAWVADIGGEHLEYVRQSGVETTVWNLCSDAQPFESRFDFIFFSEVIEHLPIPGHLVLGRLRAALRPGGTLICSTPNLYRPRNIVYLAIGKPIFDYFTIPLDRGLGHVLEYSVDHLRWQFNAAGFTQLQLKLVQMGHSPNDLRFRAMYWLGSPIFLIPRFRDNIVVVATR